MMKSMAEDDHKERLEWIREELDLLREMYKLARTIKPMKRRWVLDNIVDQGFFLACSAAEEEFKLGGWRTVEMTKRKFGRVKRRRLQELDFKLQKHSLEKITHGHRRGKSELKIR